MLLSAVLNANHNDNIKQKQKQKQKQDSAASLHDVLMIAQDLVIEYGHQNVVIQSKLCDKLQGARRTTID